MNTNIIKTLTALLAVTGLTISASGQDLIINSATAISGYLDLSGTNLRIGDGGDGSVALSGSINAPSGVWLGCNSGDSGALTLTDSGSLFANFLYVGYGGSGTLVLTDNACIKGYANSYIGNNGGTGSVLVSGSAYWTLGTLYLGYSAADTGTLTLTDSGSISSINVNVGYRGRGEATVSGSAYWQVSNGLIVGNDGGAGTLHLTDSGSISASSLNIHNGEVIISGSAYFNSSAPVFVGSYSVDTGTLRLTDSGSLSSGMRVWVDSQCTLDITLTGSNHARINAWDSGLLGGTLNLSFGNSGTLRASEASGTFTFLHTSNGITGSFSATNLNASGVDYATILTADQTANDFTATSDLSWNQALHGNFTVSGSTTFIVDTILSDTGAVNSLTKNGDGTLIFESISAYTGSTVINSGTVIYDQSGNQTLNGISGSGILVQKGSGTLTVSVASNYNGTVINNTDFSLGGVDQTIHTLINNGNVHFVNLGKTLTLTNLGGNGDFHMDVNITTGESDKIVVTGTLSGTHRLNITNIGGDSGNDFDITLATAANHDGGTFISDFDIGMFTYELQGTGTRYYITRATDPAPPTPPTPPQAGPTGEDLLADLPSQSQSWFDNMNNISNHLGDLRVNASANASGARERRPLGGGILDAVWIKSYGQQVNVSGKVVGASFREYQYGIDAGTDHRWTLDKNNTLIAGAFVGYGSLDRTLRNGLQNDGSTDNYHFGLYGIWLHESGLYADFIAKGQYADHEVNAWDASNNHTTADYNNWGGGITLDLGKKFEFQDGWYAEPSLSAGYAHFTGESYTAHNTSPFNVTITDADVLQFKLGIQFGRTITLSNGGILQPYVKVSGVEQLSTGGKLKASDAEWRPTLDGASAEVGGGIIWQLNNQHQLTLDYEASFGGKYDKPWGLTAGYRYQF